MELKINFAEGVTKFVKGDPGRLRQVLNNLINNAIKFTSAGSIEVRVFHEMGAGATIKFRFEVVDTGIGITKEALSRMFKAFSQADATMSRRFGGTGLGLSISKLLVDKFGGEIGVLSEPGAGTTFWFTIVLLSAAPPAITTPRRSEVNLLEVLGRPIRVLVAEDNAINQKIVLKLLSSLGVKADAVASGLEVIESLRDISYDLILMDCQMPEMDGYEATGIIRKSRALEWNEIPIIALTANAIQGDEQRCLAAGMDAYLTKPISKPMLIEALQLWLQARPRDKLRG